MSEKERHKLVKEILHILNERKVRATYSAVGCVLDVEARKVGKKYLGEPRHCASWVVIKRPKGDGKPSRKAGYEECHYHPDLSKSGCIKSCCKLRKWLDLPPASKHRRGCACYRRTEEHT